MTDHATGYDHRELLHAQIGDAREALTQAHALIGLPAYVGRLEALLKLICDSAEAILDETDPTGPGVSQPRNGWGITI